MHTEYRYDAIQLATGRWQVVNCTTNKNVGEATTRANALQRAHEFNHPWRGAGDAGRAAPSPAQELEQ